MRCKLWNRARVNVVPGTSVIRISLLYRTQKTNCAKFFITQDNFRESDKKCLQNSCALLKL